MKKIACITIVISFLAFNVWSQEDNSFATMEDVDRPTVALVLAGGGARGFSHIPVIELIEELGIPIDMVIGTSAGAIIGGLYSAGYSGEEVAQELLYLDWPSLFQDSTTRPLESALGSHSIDSNLVNVQLNSDLSLELGKGLLTGQNIYNRFKSLTARIPSYIHFDSLITPFRATAVDLLTGEMVVMEQGDLVEAIRSSMSIPAVFEPFPIDGRYYMDGFTRNNLPIKVAKDLGYDIIIAVEITDRLLQDVETFDANPLTTLNQVLALQQNVVVSEDYEMADLIIYPNIYEFGQMDYDSAVEIYEKGKKEAERYREELTALRSRIYPDFNAQEQSALIQDTEELTDNGFSFTFVAEDTAIPYERRVSYSNLPKIDVEDIVLNNVLQSDSQTILSEFEKIKDAPLGGNELENLLNIAYQTGNYILVTTRIDKRVEGNSLEINFIQKKRKVVHVGYEGTFEGSLSNSSTWALHLAGYIQFRDINDLGGMISLKTSVFNTTGLEALYMQPLSEKVFLQAKANYANTLDVVSSGFKKTDVSGSQFRQANLSLACGIFFSPEHKLFNELGLRWIDSNLNQDNPSLLSDAVDPVYSFDFSSRYTFSTLDYNIFATKGFYNDFKATGVIPIAQKNAPILFDVLSTNFVTAVSLSDITSIAINAFAGTNISEVLDAEQELITKYGFTTYDRTFFPHVMQRDTYGIHKLALKFDFQFKPKRQLTILGGQFFSGFGGAVGDVWSDYDSLITFEDLEWQSSAFAGLRIKDSVGIILRAGAGSYENDIAPFISLDFMAKHY